MGEKIFVIDDIGFVELMWSPECGGESLILEADDESRQRKRGDNPAADARRIEQMVERGESSTRFGLIMFRIKCPIFVARQLMRQWVGMALEGPGVQFIEADYLEMSRRYTKAEPEFYIIAPENWRGQLSQAEREKWTNELWGECSRAAARYMAAINAGIAPEQARDFLHVNTYTEYAMSTNAEAIMRLLDTRLMPGAQWETRQYARAVECLFEQAYPNVVSGWRKHRKNARIEE